MVGSGHDDETGDCCVRDSKPPGGPSVPRDEQHLQGDPHRPGHVQGGHGGIKVRRDRRRLVCDIGDDRGVDKPRSWDQPRGRHRKDPEHEKPDGVYPYEGVARRTVGNRMPPVDPQEDDQRHREVHHLVVPARGHLPAQVMTQQPVHCRLHPHVQRRFDRQQPPAVLKRESGTCRREVPDPVIEEDEQQHDQDFS